MNTRDIAFTGQFHGALCPMHPHAVIAIENVTQREREWGPSTARRNARNLGVPERLYALTETLETLSRVSRMARAAFGLGRARP